MKSPKDTYLRVSFRITKDQSDRIKEIAKIRRVSVKSLFLSAIEYYVNEGGAEKNFEKYLLSLGPSIKNLKVDTEILSEMLSFYIMHYFCYTPELPEVQRKALLLSGKNRHAKFMELLAKKMQGKGTLFGELLVKDVRQDGELENLNLK